MQLATANNGSLGSGVLRATSLLVGLEHIGASALLILVLKLSHSLDERVELGFWKIPQDRPDTLRDVFFELPET